MSIQLQQVSKRFQQTQVLAPLDLIIEQGEMLALLGPSGSGKTTLLRMLAGLESCEQGKLFFAQRDVTHVHVRERKIGFMFQHYALFGHMSVADNIAFGLTVLPRKQRPSKAAIGAKVRELLQMIQLEHLAKRYPAQLSGGQKQRVALARALATEPNVLLLDEPFGALDAKVRQDLRHWLRELHQNLGFTSIFVTHDQEEAFEVADRVAILNNGKIEQIASPTELFAKPANRFVFDFLGAVNRFKGVLQGQQLINSDAFFNLPTTYEASSGDLYFRTHELAPSKTPDVSNNLRFSVQNISPVGAEIRISLSAENLPLDSAWELVLSHAEHSQLQFKKGDICYVRPRIGHLFIDKKQVPTNLIWHSEKASSMHLSVIA